MSFLGGELVEPVVAETGPATGTDRRLRPAIPST